jgi:serine protease Do
MKANRFLIWLVVGGLMFDAAQGAWAADMPPVQEPDPQPPTRPSGGGGRGGRFGRGRGSENQKNSAPIKAAFRDVAAATAAATVRVLSNGTAVALGTVVEADGYIVTKASLLPKGKLTCRFKDGRELEATNVCAAADYDLALLCVSAHDLPAVTWRQGTPPAGTIVSATAPAQEPLAIGVISAAPRRIPAGPRPGQPQGWLGVSLGDADSGVGIDNIVVGSAAEKAGLKAGDCIQSIDGIAMKTIEQVRETISSHAPGQAIKLKIQRDKKDLELSATLGQPEGGTRNQQDRWGGGPFSERRAGFPWVLPHDTPLQPSECGGPLVDAEGKVVGINIARALRVTSYAIPADIARRLVGELKNKQR